MSGLILSILVFLLVGGLASAWLLGVRLRRERREIGLRALSDMHWREFQRLVVESFRGRGYERAPGRDAGDHEGLVELRHDGRDWLLSTRHGAGHVLGLAAVNEFASLVRLRGAAGGWMATPGALAPETVSQARMHRIELLDGAGTWAAIEPVLEPAQREAIVGDARRRVARELALAWGLAAIAGVTALLLAGRGPTPAPAPTAAAPAMAPAAGPRPLPPSAQAQPEVVPDDPAALEQRRRRLASAVATLPWVDRAVWSTQSTLLVHLAGEPDKNALCALVEPYPELRASRLQLQPPRDSDRPVRFIQCRSF